MLRSVRKCSFRSRSKRRPPRPRSAEAARVGVQVVEPPREVPVFRKRVPVAWEVAPEVGEVAVVPVVKGDEVAARVAADLVVASASSTVWQFGPTIRSVTCRVQV
jgi:hypothetical protein